MEIEIWHRSLKNVPQPVKLPHRNAPHRASRVFARTCGLKPRSTRKTRLEPRVMSTVVIITGFTDEQTVRRDLNPRRQPTIIATTTTTRD
jgi:hypothetical protein